MKKNQLMDMKKFQVQVIHFDAEPSLLKIVDRKLSKLSIFDAYIIHGDVYIKLEHDGNAQKGKLVEIKLHMKRTALFAKATEGTFEAALEMCISSLLKQAKRYKDKLHS